eukprot:52657-Hanusia_phi.AAC.10
MDPFFFIRLASRGTQEAAIVADGEAEVPWQEAEDAADGGGHDGLCVAAEAFLLWAAGVRVVVVVDVVHHGVAGGVGHPRGTGHLHLPVGPRPLVLVAAHPLFLARGTLSYIQ